MKVATRNTLAAAGAIVVVGASAALVQSNRDDASTEGRGVIDAVDLHAADHSGNPIGDLRLTVTANSLPAIDPPRPEALAAVTLRAEFRREGASPTEPPATAWFAYENGRPKPTIDDRKGISGETAAEPGRIVWMVDNRCVSLPTDGVRIDGGITSVGMMASVKPPAIEHDGSIFALGDPANQGTPYYAATQAPAAGAPQTLC